MKIMIFLAALTIPLMAGTMFIGYQSSIQKKEVVQADLHDDKQDLNAAQKDTNAVIVKATTDEEWEKFDRSGFELKIKTNEMRITELNIKIQKPTEIFDAFYVQKIANLEKENRYLKSRLEGYDKSQSNK